MESSESEKSEEVQQKCSVDEAMRRAENLHEYHRYDREEAALVLEAEVRRLREELYAEPQQAAQLLGKEVNRLREENARLKARVELVEKYAGERNYCDSCGKSILNIVTAHAKLARVEALLPEWSRAAGPDNSFEQAGDELEAALKDEP